MLLALIATLSASAPPPGRLPGEVTAAARQLAAALRQARSDAMAQNRAVTVAIDVAARRYRVDAREAVLPPQVTLTVDAAQTEQADATTGGIRFFPDGSSTGGRIDVRPTAEESRANRIAVDRLTGRISVSSGRGAAR